MVNKVHTLESSAPPCRSRSKWYRPVASAGTSSVLTTASLQPAICVATARHPQVSSDSSANDAERCSRPPLAPHSTESGIRNPERMLLVLSLLADRMSLRGIHRVTGVKPDITLAYQERAASHVEVIEALLQRSYKVTRVQLDALWAFVGHKGEKGGAPKKRSVAPSGALGQSTSTHGCGSAAP